MGEYFLWVAVDDLLLPEFLEKNLHILETNQNVVTSISKVKMFGDFVAQISHFLVLLKFAVFRTYFDEITI